MLAMPYSDRVLLVSRMVVLVESQLVLRQESEY